MKSMVRLSTLSEVDASSCSAKPTGRRACYLADPDERQANFDAFDDMDAVQKENALLWFELLKNGAGKANISKLLRRAGGFQVKGMSNVGEEEYIAAVGAGHRSLLDKDLDIETELYPIAEFLDKNGDGKITWGERGMLQDCSDMASSSSKKSYNSYVRTLGQLISQKSLTWEEWATEIATEGGTAAGTVIA